MVNPRDLAFYSECLESGIRNLVSRFEEHEYLPGYYICVKANKHQMHNYALVRELLIERGMVITGATQSNPNIFRWWNHGYNIYVDVFLEYEESGWQEREDEEC